MPSVFPQDRPRYARLILASGLLAATLATVASAVALAVLSATVPSVGSTSPKIWEIVRTVLLLIPITAVSCGSFGLLAGLAGSALLSLRAPNIHSHNRFLIESSIAGFLLGLAFPLFDRLINPFSSNLAQTLLSAPIGLGCAAVCALVLGHRFVPEHALNPPPIPEVTLSYTPF